VLIINATASHLAQIADVHPGANGDYTLAEEHHYGKFLEACLLAIRLHVCAYEMLIACTFRHRITTTLTLLTLFRGRFLRFLDKLVIQFSAILLEQTNDA
jgi:hypothetical protein